MKFTDIGAVKNYVRDKVNIYDIINEDLKEHEWKEESNETFVTTSPFRDEQNPSFKVQTVNGKFRDWGDAQYSGDVFSWVQLYHGLTFPEAITHVADRCKVDISHYIKELTEEEKQISRYKYINSIAAEWMHDYLISNGVIRDNYLSRSRFDIDMIKPYQVGYSRRF